jgi:hypothetical protein
MCSDCFNGAGSQKVPFALPAATWIKTGITFRFNSLKRHCGTPGPIAVK